MNPPDQHDDVPENPSGRAGPPNPAQSDETELSEATHSPKASDDNRGRSAARKTEHVARATMDRARPLAHRIGQWIAQLVRRVWLWLAPRLQHMQERAAVLLQRFREWAAPQVQRIRERTAPLVQRIQRRAAPHVERIQRKVAPYAERVRQWAAPYVQRIRERLAPHVATIRAKLPSSGRHHRAQSRIRSTQVTAAIAAFGVLAIVVGTVGPDSEHHEVNRAVEAADIPAPAAAPAPGQAPAAPKALSGDEPEEPEEPEEPDKPEVNIAPNASGIDVSNHNGNIDWGKVAASGKEFAFVLATDGASFTNPMFQQQFQGAKKAGLLTSAYHFARPTGSATAQADRLLDTMGTSNGDRTLPPVLDMEVSPSGGGCYGKTPGQMHKWMQTFLDRVKDRTGEKGIVYANPSFWSQCMNGSEAFSEYPLWVAAYGVDSPSVPGGWDKYTFWQFTSKGSVPGVDGYTDINKFQGSGEDLLELAE